MDRRLTHSKEKKKGERFGVRQEPEGGGKEGKPDIPVREENGRPGQEVGMVGTGRVRRGHWERKMKLNIQGAHLTSSK